MAVTAKIMILHDLSPHPTKRENDRENEKVKLQKPPSAPLSVVTEPVTDWRKCLRAKNNRG